MTYGAFTQDFEPFHCVRRGRRLDPRMGLCVIALGVTTSVGIWAMYPQPLPSDPQIANTVAAPASPVVQKTAIVVALRKDRPKAIAAAIAPHVNVERGLLDPELTSSYGAVVFARNAPLRPSLASPAHQDTGAPAQVQVATAPQIVPEQVPVSPILVETPPPHVAPLVADTPPQPAVPRLEGAPQVETPVIADVPLPQPRPANLGVARTAPARVAYGDRDIGGQGAATSPMAAAEPGQPTFFDKLFGRPKDTGPVLAYAAPEDGLVGNVLRNTVTRPQAAPDRYTAVYNITSHTVTLPDGTQLEAHSGLGAAKDNPRSVAMRMVGATPPNLYDLTVRESPFHGVRALRLTPTGGTTYGRAGLLAHTYMLRGHSGESNGCVVFRDYEAFLRAYESGTIRRLAVVAGV